MRLTLGRPKAIEFEIGQSQQRLTISCSVSKHFKRHQQTRKSALEAGGQLFARLSLEEVVIEKATGPRESDFRARTLYVPDRFAEQREIDFWHKERLHYVGDWHTHPEERPQPSGSDRDSVRESFVRSKHSLKGFLLVIVGTGELSSSLYVSLNNAEDELELIARPYLIPGGK